MLKHNESGNIEKTIKMIEEHHLGDYVIMIVLVLYLRNLSLRTTFNVIDLPIN